MIYFDQIRCLVKSNILINSYLLNSLIRIIAHTMVVRNTNTFYQRFLSFSPNIICICQTNEEKKG